MGGQFLMSKILSFLKNPRVLHFVTVFATAVVSQPAFAAMWNGSVPVSVNLVVSLLAGALAAVLPKTKV